MDFNHSLKETLFRELQEDVVDSSLDFAMPNSSIYDVQYTQNRPLLLIQCFCIFGLLFLKYFSHLTPFALKSF